MKYLPILLFIAALNIAIKKCSSPEVEVKKIIKVIIIKNILNYHI